MSRELLPLGRTIEVGIVTTFGADRGGSEGGGKALGAPSASILGNNIVVPLDCCKRARSRADFCSSV